MNEENPNFIKNKFYQKFIPFERTIRFKFVNLGSLLIKPC